MEKWRAFRNSPRYEDAKGGVVKKGQRGVQFPVDILQYIQNRKDFPLRHRNLIALKMAVCAARTGAADGHMKLIHYTRSFQSMVSTMCSMYSV